jgi:Zn-dependent protease
VNADNILFQISIWALPAIIAITFHEASHGLVARWFGDDTAYMLGRVTFNPLKHIDPFGTILLPGMLLLAHAPFLFGYAKPVPVNFGRLNHPKRDMIWVAAAGPVVNILLAIVSAALAHLVIFFPAVFQTWAVLNLRNSLVINLILAVFNLIPLPPLDGGRVLVGILPMPLARPLARLERWGMFILIGLLFILPLLGQTLHRDLNVLAWLLEWPVEQLYALVSWVTGTDLLQ